MLSVALSLLLVTAPQDPPAPRDLAALLRAHRQQLGEVLEHARDHRLQILLAEPIARPDGTVALRRSRFGDPRCYVYPASTIKLGAAVAALLECNARNARTGSSLGLDSALSIQPRFPGDVLLDRDATNVDGGLLTIGHCIRRICLVSDNDSFNRLYDFVGQQRLHEVLWGAGFRSFRIHHRLSDGSSAPARQSRPVLARDGGATVRIEQPDSTLALTNDLWDDLQLGTACMVGGKRVEGPMSCATKNAVSLDDLQDLLIEVVHPEIDSGKRGFPELGIAQRAFLVQALGELPRESRNPVYDAKAFPDDYVKFVLPGVRKVIPAAQVRIYSKVGLAYGCTLENAWVEDLRTGRGFALAAALYTNPDGVMNDDRYGYEELALPFLAALGEVIARAVLGEQ